MYPFLQKQGSKKLIKLHRELYDRAVLEDVKKQEPERIASISSNKDYYFLEVATHRKEEYFHLLNSLIYLERNK